MVAPDLAEWIRSGGLLRFRSHSRCGHPYVGSAGAQEEAAKPYILSQPRQYAKDAALDSDSPEGVYHADRTKITPGMTRAAPLGENTVLGISLDE